MANPATLYRFRLDVSDIPRGFYDVVDFRLGMHPSETPDYLLTRALAYALNCEPGLSVTPGLCAGDEPALSLPSPQGGHGAMELWIDLGNPSPRKLHKAAKAARRVRVYTYKDPHALVREAAGERIHRAPEIEIFGIEPALLRTLAGWLERDNAWTLIHDQDTLTVTAGEQVASGAITRVSLPG
jgi:uncharacterized protein YaeQ